MLRYLKTYSVACITRTYTRIMGRTLIDLLIISMDFYGM